MTRKPRALSWAVLAVGLGAASIASAQIAAPRLGANGRIHWTPIAYAAGPPDSVMALRRQARAATGSGDPAADSLWGALARAFPFWAPAATRERASLAIAAGRVARADSILEAADRAGWPDPDRADLLARRATLRLQLGDRDSALDFARQTIRRYPSLAGASRALALLEGAIGRPGLPADDERIAAEVEFLRGDRSDAARRLARMFVRSRDPERWRIALREAEMLHAAREFDAARGALATLLHASRAPEARARAVLERARVRRDAGASDSALVDFALAEQSAEPGVRATARWERARELESCGRWSAALAAYARAALEDSVRADDAAFRAGVVALASGARDSARTWFVRGRGEGARFWAAMLLRPQAIMVADTTLRILAHTPGYSFYAIAARESLGLGGWPGVRTPRPDTLSGALDLAARLIATGEIDDGVSVLDRWSLGDARLHPPLGPGPRVTPGALLAAAELADGIGRFGLGGRLGQQAMESCRGCADSTGWGFVPWRYPPAFEREFANAESSLALQNAAGRPDRALLSAICWQESKFNPRARSRSNALGLFQLKPSEEALLDSSRSVRLGARYLQHLVERFDGDTLLAIAAYNAGPGTIERWVAERAWGDRALDCELIARPETEDYVKKVLAVRQAYRELRPTSLPSP